MQTVSSGFLSTLQASHVTTKKLTVVVEIYGADALPGASGFDPSSSQFLQGFAAVGNVNFMTRSYARLLISVDAVDKTLKKSFSSASFTLSNSSRAVVDFQNSVGFEGLICVIREIDRVSSAGLTDSIVHFVGRCEKPDAFARSNEQVSISVTQIINQNHVKIPRRTLTTDDFEGRAPTDPLFEGFRTQQRSGTSTYTEVVSKRFLLFFTKKKTITHTVQWSSVSDFKSDTALPEILGRAQAQVIHLAYADIGSYIAALSVFCEGEIQSYTNVRSVTPPFAIKDIAYYYGKPGSLVASSTTQMDDDPSWIFHGIYSRTAYIRFSVSGSAPDQQDPAPDIVAIILGRKVPFPDGSGSFATYKQWSDDPAYVTRWLLNDPLYFNLDNAWFDDNETFAASDYCGQILVDQANTDVVLYNNSQAAQAGTNYFNYASTGRITPSFFASGSSAASSAANQQASYSFYNSTPAIADDLTGTGSANYTSSTIPTAYRRRYTLNVALTEQQAGIDALFDVFLPAFNGYLVQKASGKIGIKVNRPVDFSFMHVASNIGDTAITVKNINPFVGVLGRIVVGAHTGNAEARAITATAYSTLGNSLTITASGGVSSSSATLTGGTSTVAPSATLTVTDATTTKTVTIDSYQLVYSVQSGETTDTAAGMIAGMINSHNVLNKYIKAVWNAGASTVTVTSRIGTLTLNQALANPHFIAIADPAAAPTIAASAGGTFLAGVYTVAYSYWTNEGKTLRSPGAAVTLTAGQSITVSAITPLPARVNKVDWYCTYEAGGIRYRWQSTNDGSGFIIYNPPQIDDPGEPIINSTAEELHRVAMSFCDNVSNVTGVGETNMVKGSFQFPLGSRQPSVNRVILKYRDASQDFQLRELRIRDKPNYKKVKKYNDFEINAAAVDNTHQAERLGNQAIAEKRDGDSFVSFSAVGEALLLEEGDVISVTDASGRFVNESIRVEDLSVSFDKGNPMVTVTGRKYRRYYYDDQVKDKLLPLPVVVNTGVNTETSVPVIYQINAAQNAYVDVGVANFTPAAQYRSIQIADNNTFTSGLVSVLNTADNEPGRILTSQVRVTRSTGLSTAQTKYIRVAHSSNNVTFGAWSNVLTVAFPDAGGSGGSGGGAGGGGGAPGAGGSCFTGETMVAINGYQSFPFEFIAKYRDSFIGGSVQSFDREGNVLADTIEDVFTHEVDEYLQVKFKRVKKAVNVTAEHPFFTANREFVPIGNLKAGDKVLRYVNGKWRDAEIESISIAKEKRLVYNLHTRSLHTYFADDFACHNYKSVPL